MKLAALAISPAVEAYICRQRDRLQFRAETLQCLEKAALEGYFSAEALDRARVLVADPLPIPDPPFTSLIRRSGFDFPSPAMIEAITFDNVIACRSRMNSSLLFHELVHTVQYRLLGVNGFARSYVGGFLTTRSYQEIPLERYAFDLQFRYEREATRFEVEKEILRDLKRV